MRCTLALLAFAACDGGGGVISVGLTTAPGSTLLDGVRTLRLEITNPPQVVTAERRGDGFDIGLDLEAGANVGALYVDGFDAAGTLVATGASPRFTFSGVDGRLVIYMSAPDSLGVAPAVLAPARSELGATVLPYGAIFAGGRAESGPSDAVQIYNAYDHSIVSGLPLPAPRSAPAVGLGDLGVYIFGGRDSADVLTASLWRFDTRVQPSGQYFIIGDKPGFARAGESLVSLGGEHFLITGSPAAELLALDGSVASREDIASLPSAAVTTVANDGMRTAFFVDENAIVRFRGGQFEMLPIPGRAGATVVAIPGGKVAVVCGTSDALRIDGASGAAETFPGIPAIPKTGCAATATGRHLLIAGGTTATGVDSTVEVYDGATLSLVTSATLAVPRTAALALPLPNDQILIAGGIDAAGAPVGTLELFTPAR